MYPKNDRYTSYTIIYIYNLLFVHAHWSSEMSSGMSPDNESSSHGLDNYENH